MTNIDSIIVESKFVKTLKLHSTDFNQDVTIVEAIGSTGDLFYVRSVISPELQRFLLCESNGKTNTIINKTYNTCYKSTAVGISNVNDNHLIVKIIPNPANTTLNISLNNENNNGAITLEIYNVLGQSVYLHKTNISDDIKNIQIDVSNYPKGMYYVRCIDDKKTISKAIIIE
jgi:hypothetical protein